MREPGTAWAGAVVKPLVLALAGLLVLLAAVPLGAAVLVTVIAAPAVAEQLRLDPCSYLSGSLATANTTATESGTAEGLPSVGSPRRASLRNPPLPVPARIKNLYAAAATRYRVPWALLAGVGMEETAHGRNTSTSSAGARGLMQFMPGTWRIYGTDGDGDGRAIITNDADSVMSASHYLATTGATRASGVRKALFAHNHATWYINDVLYYAHHYETGSNGTTETGEVSCNQSADGGDAGPVPDGPNGPCPPSGSAAERGLKPNALRALRCVKQAFPWITWMGGVGKRNNVSDHPYGRAIDFMIPAWNTAAGRARGWQVARWLQKNAATLKVKYIIFDMKVWRAYRSSQGWQPYTFFGPNPGPTLAHEDHVHSSQY